MASDASLILTSSGANAHFDLNALSTPPTDPNPGDVYYDDGTNTLSGKPDFRHYDGSAWNDLGLKHNFAATTAPGVGDDDADGYSIGSIWIDVTNNNAYIAESVSTGAANWLQINGGGGGSMTSFDLAADTGTAETVEDSETMTLTGGTGIDTSVAATNTVTIAIDSTVATLTGSQTLTNKTLTTPTIGDFTNATHDHADAAGGGQIDASVVTYTPNVLTDWDSDSDPGDVDNALDQLAERVDDLEAGGGGGGLFASVAILTHVETSGTDGGSSSTGWNARTLNTEESDPDSIVSISSNQFTPISGDYLIQWSVMVAASTTTLTFIGTRLYNVTGTASVQVGETDRALTGSSQALSGTARFTANGTDAYRIETYHSQARTTTGFGIASTNGDEEVYLHITLIKEA